MAPENANAAEIGPSTALRKDENHAAIIADPAPSAQELAQVKLRFALRGHALTRAHHRDGRVTYVLALQAYSRAFTSWGDVLAFLAQVGGPE
jgi:hypothetical protein